jgi:hypothetical protein
VPHLYLKGNPMSFTDRPAVHVRGTKDLLALIPFLLGFHPDTSMVLLAVDNGSGGIALAARLDLPTAEQPLGPVRAALDLVVTKLTALGGISVVLAGYGPADRVEPMVTAAAEALHASDIPIREALRVAGGRFWRLQATDPTPDPAPYSPDGVAFEPATSPATAAAVYAGLVALPDREALAATLAPATGPARDGMVTATVAACALLTELLDAARTDTTDTDTADPAAVGDPPDAVLDTPIGHALQAAARTYLTQIQDSYRAGQPVDDAPAATLTVLLELPSLWEFAARRTNAQAWQTAMWSDLVRRAEPPFTAPTATLLALCALQAGHGALASMAVDRALSADPQDRFAQLLDRAIAAGIDPDTVTALLTD